MGISRLYGWCFFMLVSIGISSACRKDTIDQHLVEKGTVLRWVKTGDEKTVQSEFLYNEDGRIHSRISYKNFPEKLIGSKEEHVYEDGRLIAVVSQMDFAAALNAVQYAYMRINYDYDKQGNVIQRSFYAKEGKVFKLSSFSVYEYNNRQLPVKETRFDADGISYAYNTYSYDNKGNVTAIEEYVINREIGNTQLRMKTTYKHDVYLNPYKKVYQLTENIPYSINTNNIIEKQFTDYTSMSQGGAQTTATTFSGYNPQQYPLIMNEAGNSFLLEYY